jgi:hypothetical protein
MLCERLTYIYQEACKRAEEAEVERSKGNSLEPTAEMLGLRPKREFFSTFFRTYLRTNELIGEWGYGLLERAASFLHLLRFLAYNTAIITGSNQVF